MDPYVGSIVDPISLHKYLYANANPVMWCDPTGYEATLKEYCASMAISAILSAAEYGSIYKIAGSIDNEHGTDYQSRFSWQGLVKAMILGAVSGAIGYWLKVAWLDDIINVLPVLARYMAMINLALLGFCCYIIGFNLPGGGSRDFLFALESTFFATATGGVLGTAGFSQGFSDIVGDAPGFGADAYDAFFGEVPNKDKNEFSTTSTDASVPFPTPSPIPAYA